MTKSETGLSGKKIEVSHLRKVCATEQVAAVCYRLHHGSIEFLLVRTRGGRWIFPKGSAEKGLTHAEAAALEAFEEAGVHGRMEINAFTHYRHKRGHRRHSSEISTSAHLCEVMRLGRAESYRKPTWFPAAQAKMQLREGREWNSGTELVRVVDRAVACIRRKLTQRCDLIEELQRVPFEARETVTAPQRRIAFAPGAAPIRTKLLLSAETSLPGSSDVGEVLEFRTPRMSVESAKAQPKS